MPKFHKEKNKKQISIFKQSNSQICTKTMKLSQIIKSLKIHSTTHEIFCPRIKLKHTKRKQHVKGTKLFNFSNLMGHSSIPPKSGVKHAIFWNFLHACYEAFSCFCYFQLPFLLHLFSFNPNPLIHQHQELKLSLNKTQW